MYVSKHTLIFKIGSADGERIIILNPLSGAVDIINENELGVLDKIREGSDVHGIDKQILKQFTDRGYVFHSIDGERQALLDMDQYLNDISADTEKYVVIPSYSCNLRCTYCFQHNVSRKADLISEATLERLFAAIEQLHKRKEDKSSKVHISLFGGEPLIYDDERISIIEKFVKRCEKQGYTFSVMTNGVQLKDLYHVLNSPNLNFIHVTLDGIREIHNKRRVRPNGEGSFDKICEGVEFALANKTNIMIRVNVDSQNVDTLPELASFFIDRGWIDSDMVFLYLCPVSDFSCSGYKHCVPDLELINKIFEIYSSHEHTKVISLFRSWPGIDTLVNLLDKGLLSPPAFKNCEAHIDTLALDLYGDIYACIESCGQKQFSVGRFLPELDIDQDELRKWRNRTILNDPECSDCDVNLICRGGCAFQAYYEKGSISAHVCSPIKEILEQALKHYLPELVKIAEDQ